MKYLKEIEEILNQRRILNRDLFKNMRFLKWRDDLNSLIG